MQKVIIKEGLSYEGQKLNENIEERKLNQKLDEKGSQFIFPNGNDANSQLDVFLNILKARKN